jgi:tetratricopeptide (TPR) repeat protein
VREARRAAGPGEWRNRGLMLSRSDVHAMAYDDFVRALQGDVFDQAALDGLVQTARLLKRAPDALAWLKSLTADKPARVSTLVAISQLQAASRLPADALATAAEAAALLPLQPMALEQLASLHADSGQGAALDAVIVRLRELAPERAATSYFSAVSAFLRQQPADAVKEAERAATLDPEYAAVYDLLGAAHTRLGHAAEARQAFEQSLRRNPHDSTAYANLGILELQAGNRAAAANYFAESLWLEPDSPVARQGLNEAR